MAVSLLGPLRVDGAEQLSPRDRVVLSALALHAGDVLSAEQLADALWGDAPPASWPKVVQGCVARLRRTLGRGAVETTNAGYRLTLADDEIDVRRFESLAERGRQLAAHGEPDRAADVLGKALALWRGAPLSDLDRWPDGRTEAHRLEEVRLSLQELQLAQEAAAGVDVTAEASALVASQPLREARWHLLAVALYRDGRQSEALAALRQARRTLSDELGLDPGADLVELEQAILTHDVALDAPLSAGLPDARCPYQGLVVYDRPDADLFFGRDEETAACVRVLRDAPLLVVAGPSGSGKSSLVRAGVAPRLERSGRQVSVLTPGADPAASLAGALATGGRDLVVVVDQLEELFTGRHHLEVVRAFLDTLAEETARRGVLLVLRSDQLGGFAASPALSRLVERGLHLMTAMTEPDLRAVIEGPAHAAGLRLEAGLVELLVREVEGEPGALPLLSHALAETWARREGGVLTVEGYRASGGIRGAVAQSAEQLWESLQPEQQTRARALLLRMVRLTREGEPVAARLPLSAVADDPDRRRLIDLLVRCRLATTDDRTVTLAHEAVVRAWPRLRSWLDEDAAGQLVLRHLSVAAEDWQASGRPDGELYRGPRLAAALDWRARSRPDLLPVEDAFLDAAEAQREAEREAVRARARQRAVQNRRLRTALAATALGLVLALVAGAVAVQKSSLAARTARTALVDQLVAQSAALRSTRRDLAALLAVEAHRLRRQANTRGALFGVFTGSPGFLGYLPTGPSGNSVPLTAGRMLSDGHTFLASGTDGVIRVFDVRSGYTGRHFPRPAIAPADARIDVSRDETTVAEVSWEGPADRGGRATLGVFDLRTRRRLVPDTRLPLDVGAVAVSPHGRYVAVSGYDNGHVLVFDLAGRAPLPELPTVDAVAPRVVAVPTVASAPASFRGVRHTAAVAFRPDGTLLVGSEVGVVRIVEPGNGREVRALTGAPDLTSNNTFAQSADGAVLLSTGSSGVVRWDLRGGRPQWVAAVPEDRCFSLAVLSTHVLCGGQHARVETLDLRSGGSTAATYDMQQGRVSALLVGGGDTLVQLSDSQPVLARWRLDGTGPVNRLLPILGSPTGYDSSGRLLLIVGPDTFVDFWGYRRLVVRVVDGRTGVPVLRPAGPDGAIEQAAWTGRPGRLLAWTGGGNGYLIDARRGTLLKRLQGGLGAPPEGVWLAAGARRVLAWSDLTGDAAVWEVWNVRTGEIVRSARALGQPTSTDPNGRAMVSIHHDEVRVSDVRSGAVLARRAGVSYAAVSPDGVVAASGTDGSLSLLDGGTLRRRGPQVPGTPGAISQFAFSRDGRLLAALGGDGTVRLVDMDTRTGLGDAIDVAAGAGGRIALRPDGRELAQAAGRGVLVWDLRPSHWERAACQVAGRALTREEWDTYLSAVGDYRPTCPSAG